MEAAAGAPWRRRLARSSPLPESGSSPRPARSARPPRRSGQAGPCRRNRWWRRRERRARWWPRSAPSRFRSSAQCRSALIWDRCCRRSAPRDAPGNGSRSRFQGRPSAPRRQSRSGSAPPRRTRRNPPSRPRRPPARSLPSWRAQSSRVRDAATAPPERATERATRQSRPVRSATPRRAGPDRR